MTPAVGRPAADRSGRWSPLGAWRRHGWIRLAAVLVVLGVSIPFYAIERSMEHFLWHLGYGAAAGMLLAAGTGLLRGRPVCDPVLWPLAAYAYMVVPDLIWLAGKVATSTPWPHQPWMDVFLLHVSLDEWRLATPLVLPAFLGAMAWLVWVQARDPRPADGAPA